MTPDQVERVQTTLADCGFEVTSIGSPIGKVAITADFGSHFERFETAIERARQFDTDYIRVFSYDSPDGDDPAAHRNEVMRRMARMGGRAADEGLTILHENEDGVYGDTPGRCRDLLTTVDTDAFGAVFDPADFLKVGIDPYPAALLGVVEYVTQLHVKDARIGEHGAIEPAGRGDGSLTRILEALGRRGFRGVASLEPHLENAGENGGFSGPAAYETATDAVRECLDEADVSYE